jgi:hypothetical protein
MVLHTDLDTDCPECFPNFNSFPVACPVVASHINSNYFRKKIPSPWRTFEGWSIK